jgi:hypothetical protein
MEEARYKHLANFMRQRGQKIPGVPLISLWQFMGIMGFGFTGYVLQLPAWAIGILGVVAVFSFTIYNGEFLGRRLLAVGLVYLLAVSGRPRRVTLESAWATLADHGQLRPAPTTIFLEGEGGTTVLS